MRKKEFMGHLAGLRGLAIILVVLFHMNGAVWSQGYLGVDVFLVLTGYLMFRARVQTPGTVSLREAGVYLLRRVQRIMPPMLAIIILTAVSGLFLLWWPDELFTGKLGFSACLAKANIMLQREFEDYFATDSAFVPLLHLWYLSVTLQLYLMYAVGNQLLQRLPRKALCGVLALLGLGSLVYCYYAPLAEWLGALGVHVKAGKAVSYYQTLPRVWEVMAGGLVCVLPGMKRAGYATLCTVAGLLLILLPALAGTVPGLGALTQLPCALPVVAGSVLTLRYAPESHIQRALANKALIWLGGISFSLYLVHMPIIVYMRMWEFGEASVYREGLMLAVSVALAVAFYHGIEKRRAAWWVILPLWGATLLCCRELRRTEGFRAYLPQCYWELPVYEDWQLCRDDELMHDAGAQAFPFFDGAFRFMNQLTAIPRRLQAPLLAMGDSSKKATCLLLGDSHAAHSYAGLDSALRQQGISGVYLASYIYPLYDCRENKKSDVLHESELFRWLERHPGITHIIIGQRWQLRLTNGNREENISALRRFLQELTDRGRKVIIIAPTPEFGRQASLMHYDKIFSLRHISTAEAEKTASCCSREQYLQQNADALPVLEQLRAEGYCSLVEPLSVLRPGEVFRSLSGRTMLMTDSHHMSAAQSVLIMQRLADSLRKQLLPAE